MYIRDLSLNGQRSMAQSQQSSFRERFLALQSRQTARLRVKKSVCKAGETLKLPDRLLEMGNSDGDDLALQTLTSHGGNAGDAMQMESAQAELEWRLKEAEEQKKSLEEKLLGQESELKKLRKQREEEMKALGDTGSLGALSKIVELSKKNREMTAELEAEKSRVRRLNGQIKLLEENVISLSSKVESTNDQDKWSVEASDGDTNDVEKLTSQCNKLEEKLARATSKLTEMRNQCQQYKRDLKTTQMALAKEVGEGVSVSDLLSTPSGWRGRSQQILSLQKKVHQLQQQLDYYKKSANGQSPDTKSGQQLRTVSVDTSAALSHVELKHRSMLKQLETDKKQTQQQLASELQSLQTEHSTLKQKFDAMMARNKTVTAALKDARQQVNVLLDKEKHDNQLIATLMAQQSDLNDSRPSIAQLEKQWQHNHQIVQRKSPADFTASRIRASESRSAPSIGKTSGTRIMSQMKRPTTGCGVLSSDDIRNMRDLNCQLQEQRTRCQVAEVERDRLLQLVSTLKRELDDTKQAAMAALVNLNSERRNAALLSTKLDESKLRASQPNETHPYLDDLQQRLARQEEENAIMRRAIADLRKEKKTDMEMYTELHRQTKQIFLEGVRRVKSDAMSGVWSTARDYCL
ncbi:coiled-coil domain-containing protein 13-like isoform X2 [Corticium candelabrum]|uniref:coiled-coil domain-containing protein 13-like isoform X2 n=1 Tax=Corticium candelabrum TaxID=121492 RepID=UPI002E25D4BA|nr:coiled-coil domain-containing protein 13-like isoform X2 [Corticium candelabrum]